MPSGEFIDKSSLDLLLHTAKNLSWSEDGSLPDEARDFLVQLHGALDPSSYSLFRLDDLAVMARDFWSWTDTRSPSDHIVRTRRVTDRNGKPLNYTTLEICGTDKPFIVRSVTGACLDLNINPVLVIHPIVDVTRNSSGQRSQTGHTYRESCIQIYLHLLDETACEALEAEVRATLEEITLCVTDHAAMQRRMQHSAIDVSSNTFLDEETRKESAAFLNWLADDHFTFLGSREYKFAMDENGELANEEPKIIPSSSIGILRDENRFILSRGHEPTIITDEISEFLNEADPIIIAKGSLASRVHRRVRVDYIGVKEYNEAGQVVGETRFAGLFTADAYNRQARDVPLIRNKLEHVLKTTGKLPGSHDASALKHILETYPRDELFQISEAELADISLAILQLQTRNETRLFVRRDRFDRYISALVYVPKESFHSDLRAKIADVLCRAYNGELTAFYPQYGDAPLARIHFLIDLKPDSPSPNPDALEEEIARVARSWNDEIRGLMRTHRAELLPNLDETTVTNAFSAGYKEAFDPEEAITDIRFFSELSESHPVSMRAYRFKRDEASIVRAKIYTLGEPVELSNSVPVFEDMGLFVAFETGYPVNIGENGDQYWVHALKMKSRDGKPIRLDDVSSNFEDAFEAIWTEQSVSDGFNRLVLGINASWREASLFRTLARFRKQTGMDPSQSLQIDTLTEHTRISELLLKAFRVRFDPDLKMSQDERETAGQEIHEQILEALESVASLDEDRIIRRTTELIFAIKRTNFYQLNEHGEPYSHIAIKIASRELESLPDPKPFREIFVWAPHVEGVHLRFGPVARGGLRWSDRRDDFRTEILGLVKAQQVKNAVIVPVGSKGGFFPKNLPVGGDREAIQAEGIRAYKTFIGALLQLTDNLVDGEPRHPRRTVIWDGTDPYLVVAADKGTATFSDIANEISTSLGFWLGDAFASGGSVGYDHKKMGITARGAWVAVQRHLREMGVDVQKDPVSVIGVGDMSGDVFGNGMLLSKSILLKAAFNHMHIFIDPNPGDAMESWTERKRLFDMGRSSWEDYNPELISKGGGVFSRSAKKISLTPQIRDFLGTGADTLTPNELIREIMKVEADLLWFGGIGTYVKSRQESHLDVGDKANDAVRVNADELNVRVVGEGANLGVTQEGRIDFARAGGSINTDAIDNSAGVDSSDHEVNIKILLKAAIESGALASEDRNDLLASMTDDVARLVLVHNYDQTGALTVAEASASSDLDSHERMMERLEADGILNRDVEGLPRTEDIRALREAGHGLTRPELAVLLAYAKITLFDDIVACDIPDDPYLESELYAYFPGKLHDYPKAMENHRLRREIIATRLSNDIVNLGGITFIHRVRERTGAHTAPIIRAFVAALDIFDLKPLFRDIDALDNKVSADVQTRLRLDVINALRRQVFWLTKARTGSDSINDLISKYRTGVQKLFANGTKGLSKFEQDLVDRRADEYKRENTPDELAARVALIQNLALATDLVDLSNRTDRDVVCSAILFSAVGECFKFEKLRFEALDLKQDQHWDRLALRGLVETLIDQQNTLTERISDLLESDLNDYSDATTVIQEFIDKNRDSFNDAMGLLNEIERAGSWSFAKLVLVSNAIRSFIDASDPGLN